MSRILVIGDIHGCYLPLMSLLNVIDVKLNDKLIFVGDYIDRGKDNKLVVDKIMRLKQELGSRVVTLIGNHEDMALKAFNGGQEDYAHWIRNGGETTLKSYDNDMEVAKRNLTPFIDNLTFFYETKTHIVSHASFPNVKDGGRADPCDKLQQATMLWDRCVENYHGKKTLVVGHTPRREVVYFTDINVVSVDTGCFRTNILSAYDILHNEVYNSNGEVFKPIERTFDEFYDCR